MAHPMVWPALTQNPDGYRDSPGFRQHHRRPLASPATAKDAPQMMESLADTNAEPIWLSSCATSRYVPDAVPTSS